MIHIILIDSLLALVGLLGVAALYCGLFLYPDEENKLHNRIEQFWVNIDERRRLSNALVLARRVAALTNQMLDRTLGKRLFSVRMVAITTCYSLLGLTTWQMALLRHSIANARLSDGSIVDIQLDLGGLWLIFHRDLIISGLLLAAGLIAGKYEKPWATLAALSVAGYALWSQQLPFVPETWHSYSDFNLKLDASFAISLVADILYVAAVRSTIRWLIREPSVKSFLGGVSLQLAILILFVALPRIMGTAGDSSSQGADRSITVGFHISNAFVLFGLNTSTGIFALSFLVVLLFMTMNKLMWPALSRAIHPLARFQVIRNRKLMIGIGILCLGAISPSIAHVLKKLQSLF